MIGLLVITHGGLADELVAAARTIVGACENVAAVSIGWDDEVSDARRRIVEGIRELDQGEGVILLTDMFGGTPTNVALSLLAEEKVEILTGANLPMIIKFTNLRGDASLEDCARILADKGRRSIHVASTVLLGPPDKTPGE
jgi:PTS system mannose-specific IIA component